MATIWFNAFTCFELFLELKETIFGRVLNYIATILNYFKELQMVAKVMKLVENSLQVV